jgi:asparagine synthase (glutamine-hydrolysing)
MCGIYGIFRRGRACDDVHDRELRRMGERLMLRGPDGHGTFRSPDGRVLLGHRRLAIIDLSERAAQPMTTRDGSFTITFNGEIYNYRALRVELEREGYVFDSDSDTEVLLHAYARHGAAMVHKLRGMFAFVLFDATKGALLLARDPYGIKPLYYADDGKHVRFASQVRALRASGALSSEADAAGLVGFYLLGSVPEPFTIARGVRALPAGHTLWIEAGVRSEPKAYFDIAQEYRTAGADVASSVTPESLYMALRESVEHHLVADVAVGAFLSAGIDSGAVVGLARDVLGEDARLSGVTLAFDELRGSPADEAPLAATTAKQYGVEHHVRYVAQAEFEEDMPMFFDAMDQPTVDGLNTWFVSKATRELGLKVALSGLGGDELLGGYSSFADLPRWHRAVNGLGPLTKLGPLARVALAPLTRPLSLSPKAASMVELGATWPGAYLLRRGLFLPWELPALLGDEQARVGLAELGLIEHIGARLVPDPGNDFVRVATLEASLYMRNQLLRDTDWTSMAHSLEVRVPLVDAVLLQSCGAKLGFDQDGLRSKRSLAQSPAHPLPAEVTGRLKTGFTTPIDRWLTQSEMLGVWRRHAALRRRGVQWARRYSHCVAMQYLES